METAAGGLTLGQAVAAYTLTAICVALADPAAATTAAGGGGGSDGGDVRPLLMAVLDLVCTAPRRQGESEARTAVHTAPDLAASDELTPS